MFSRQEGITWPNVVAAYANVLSSIRIKWNYFINRNIFCVIYYKINVDIIDMQCHCCYSCCCKASTQKADNWWCHGESKLRILVWRFLNCLQVELFILLASSIFLIWDTKSTVYLLLSTYSCYVSNPSFHLMHSVAILRLYYNVYDSK